MDGAPWPLCFAFLARQKSETDQAEALSLLDMAHPIEPSPIVKGEDARRLLQSLDDRCSNEEAERRMAWAKKALAEMTRPKKGSSGSNAP